MLYELLLFLQNWKKIRKPLFAKYPVGRYGHAATVISGCVQEILIVIGGLGNNWETLNDCWVIDVSQKKHKKVLYTCYYDHMMI